MLVPILAIEQLQETKTGSFHLNMICKCLNLEKICPIYLCLKQFIQGNSLFLLS